MVDALRPSAGAAENFARHRRSARRLLAMASSVRPVVRIGRRGEQTARRPYRRRPSRGAQRDGAGTGILLEAVAEGAVAIMIGKRLDDPLYRPLPEQPGENCDAVLERRSRGKRVEIGDQRL